MYVVHACCVCMRMLHVCCVYAMLVSIHSRFPCFLFFRACACVRMCICICVFCGAFVTSSIRVAALSDLKMCLCPRLCVGASVHDCMLHQCVEVRLSVRLLVHELVAEGQCEHGMIVP